MVQLYNKGGKKISEEPSHLAATFNFGTVLSCEPDDEILHQYESGLIIITVIISRQILFTPFSRTAFGVWVTALHCTSVCKHTWWEHFINSVNQQKCQCLQHPAVVSRLPNPELRKGLLRNSINDIERKKCLLLLFKKSKTKQKKTKSGL